MFRRTHASSIVAAGLMTLAGSCASPESDPPVLAPPADAAADAIPDVSAEVAPDADADTSTSDAADAISEGDDGAEADAPMEADGCVPQVPLDAAEGPCTAGTIDRQWCGACGHRQRFCGNDAQWKPWSDCLEDELAVCSQCETREVSCGGCGKRVVSCETSQDTCRWVLGVCAQAGECVQGEYELDPGGCAQGQVRVRWCSESCAWGDAGPCETGPGWEPLPQAPLGPREAFGAVVAGSKWFLWGGIGESGYLADGATFDPSANSWQLTAPALWPSGGAEAGVTGLSARSGMAIAWTGTEVIVHGGVGEGDTILGDGASWSESSGWAGLAQSGAPSPRRGATAVWAESAGVVIIWGGRGPYGGAASGGGRYDPKTDAWQAISAAPGGARQGHTATWDPAHGRMIVWGGASDASGPPERSGAAYDPVADAWTPIPEAPIRRRNAFAFWDAASARMIVVMGEDGAWNGPRGDGAAYDPSSGAWALLPELALTGYAPGWGLAAAWGAGRAWVTGGDVAWAGGMTALGARYDVASDVWGKLPAIEQARGGHAAAFLGGLLVWGGRGQNGLVASGARLRDSSFGP